MSGDRDMRDENVAAPAPGPAAPASGRRSDLDLLRLVLVLAAFPLSCARALAGAGSAGVGPAWIAILGQEGAAWLVPLFLGVSGASARHALAAHGAAGFVLARVLRLFVPLAAAALVAISLSAADARGLRAMVGIWGWFPWYLAVVFGLSLLLLLAREALRTRPGARLRGAFSAAARVPGSLALSAAAAAAAAAVPCLPGIPRVPFVGRWGSCFHAVVFLLGFLLHHDHRLLAKAARHGWAALAGGALLAATAVLVPGLMPAGHAPATWAVAALRGAAAWSLCLAALGLAARLLARARPVRPVVREASMPFSVLAQPVAGLLAAAGSGLALPAGLRLGLLAVVSFASVAILYAAVRRVTVLRFCLGLTPSGSRGGSS